LAVQQACPPGRTAASLAYCGLQFVRRLTTKELVFQKVLALGNVRVNGKKWVKSEEYLLEISDIPSGKSVGELLLLVLERVSSFI
jgi:hypothetical protein